VLAALTMPPCQSTQARTRPQQGLATVTPGPTSGNVPAWHSRCTHTQVTGLAQGEEFNLDNISGSENDDDAQPVHQSGGCPQEVTPRVQGEGSGVNDPSIAPLTDSKPMGDIHYFFNKSPENFTCKECR
jgi:hypothetical protein